MCVNIRGTGTHPSIVKAKVMSCYITLNLAVNFKII